MHSAHDWLIDLLDDGERYGDGGREIRVQLAHRESELCLHATVVYYGEANDAVLAEIVRNDLLLCRRAVDRLARRLCVAYGRL